MSNYKDLDAAKKDGLSAGRVALDQYDKPPTEDERIAFLWGATMAHMILFCSLMNPRSSAIRMEAWEKATKQMQDVSMSFSNEVNQQKGMH